MSSLFKNWKNKKGLSWGKDWQKGGTVTNQIEFNLSSSKGNS